MKTISNNTITYIVSAIVSITALVVIAVTSGCALTQPLWEAGIATLDAQYDEWVASGGRDAAISNFWEKAQSNPIKPEPPKTADAVPASELNWTFGGFKGGNAVFEGEPTIQNLVVNKTGLSYSWAKGDLALWGAKDKGDASKALACLFVKRSDGEWVGGKFDWISSGRLTRGFPGHVLPNAAGETYNGWSLDGVPNPCEVAFVIVKSDGTRRTNIITAEWRR